MRSINPAAARLFAVAAGVIGLSACGEAEFDPNKLAARGMINERAPVKATLEIVIQAPPEKVWRLLTDMKDWATWQPDVSEVDIQAAPAVAVPFTWSTGGMTIHSTIRLLEPVRTLCWTGRAFHIHAIHVWNLSPLPDGRVLVETRESMDGWLVDRFYSSSKLEESNWRWLEHLKKTAES